MAPSSNVPPKYSRLLQLHNSTQIFLLFIVYLKEAVNISEHTASNDWNTVNNELGRTWERAVAA
jgi:hypothetical protein